MSKDARVPKIRFQDFTEEWKIQSLKDCFQERIEKSDKGDLISVTINAGIKKFSELKRHDISSEDKSNYKRVKVGDIAYNSMRMWQGASGRSNYTGILSPAYTVIKPNSNIDSLFFAFMFKTPTLIHMFRLKSQGITSDTWNLKFPAFSRIAVHVPPLSEQKAIGNIFKTIDSLTFLEQQKHQKLIELKQAMLAKMFPHKGETIPEIRFPGFTNPWCNTTFSEFVHSSAVRNSKNLPLDSYSVSNTLGFVPQNEQFEFGGMMSSADKTAYWIVYPGSFAYNPARINVGSIGYQSKDTPVIVSSLYEVFETNTSCDDGFLWYWLKSEHFSRQVELYQEGGVRLYFFFDKLLKTEISLPPSIKEQEAIGQFFKVLDDRITQQAQRVAKLKQLKQALLEKMFV